MDREQLERLARSEQFIHRLTRDDLVSIVKLLDAQDARNDATRDEHGDAYALVSAMRTAAGLLKERADQLAEYFDPN